MSFELPDDGEAFPASLRVGVVTSSSRVRAIEARIDGRIVGVDHEPPFELELTSRGVTGDRVTLLVVAYREGRRPLARTRQLRVTPALPAAGSVVNPDSVRARIPFELSFVGPWSLADGDRFNPYAHEFEVRFEGPGDPIAVPGFFAGDGRGRLDGDIWQVRVSLDQPGSWSWHTSSDLDPLDGLSGRLEVLESPDGALPMPRLSAVDGFYLRRSDGRAWLKSGADEPEDVLANRELPTMADRRAAVDSLASWGVNSLYLMTHTIGGDGNNVWPWLGGSPEVAMEKHRRFDHVRLSDWDAFFRHMQRQGIVIHLVLEDDSGWTGFDRRLYYRHMVAHFGHHPGLIWNLSEEYQENYTAADISYFAAMLDEIDPYDHPTTVHIVPPLSAWEPFVGDEHLDLTSFQTREILPEYGAASEWYEMLTGSGRPIPIGFDETAPIAPSDRGLAREHVWSVLLGGGNVELRTWPVYEGRYTFQDYREIFEDMVRARRFLESSVPFWRMSPRPDLVSDASTYLLALPGEAYVAYFRGGGSVDLTEDSGVFEALWFDPVSGDSTALGSVSGGRIVRADSLPVAVPGVLLLSAPDGGRDRNGDERESAR